MLANGEMIMAAMREPAPAIALGRRHVVPKSVILVVVAITTLCGHCGSLALYVGRYKGFHSLE